MAGPTRVLYHFTGNRRGSVFRRHLGTALLARDDPSDSRIPVWFSQRRVPFPEVETAVSRELRERFSFSCVRMDDARERLNLEKGLIALLSQHPVSSPSPGWLGRFATHPAIRESSLWNTQHVGRMRWNLMDLTVSHNSCLDRVSKKTSRASSPG